MTPEQSAAYVMGQAACLMAEVAGMQADNALCALHGASPAFRLEDFKAAINRYSCHHNAALAAFEG